MDLKKTHIATKVAAHLLMGLFFAIPLFETAQALTWEELSQAGQGQVLGLQAQTQYEQLRLTSLTNRSLSVFITPKQFNDNNWNYEISWTRTANLAGSWYVSLAADRTQIKAQCANAPRSSANSTVACPLQTGTVLQPGEVYRFEFYSWPNKKGTLLLSKRFTALDAPAIQQPIVVGQQDTQACPTQITLPAGCRYEIVENNPCAQMVCNLNSAVITSPHEGEEWETGTKHNIRWFASTTPASTVNLYLQNVYEIPCVTASPAPCYQESSGLGALIAEKISNNGNYEWEMPNDSLIPGKYFKVSIIDSQLITSDNYQSKPILSNRFTIVRNKANPKFITITYPDNSASWALGSQQKIYFRHSTKILSLSISLQKYCLPGTACTGGNFILAGNFVPTEILARFNDEQIASLTFTLAASGQANGLVPGLYSVLIKDASGITSAVSNQPITITGN